MHASVRVCTRVSSIENRRACLHNEDGRVERRVRSEQGMVSDTGIAMGVNMCAKTGRRNMQSAGMGNEWRKSVATKPSGHVSVRCEHKMLEIMSGARVPSLHPNSSATCECTH